MLREEGGGGVEEGSRVTCVEGDLHKYVLTLYRNECCKVQLVSAAYLVCALTCHRDF